MGNYGAINQILNTMALRNFNIFCVLLLLYLFSCDENNILRKRSDVIDKKIYVSDTLDTLGVKILYVNKLDKDSCLKRYFVMINNLNQDTLAYHNFDICNNYSKEYAPFTFKFFWDQDQSYQLSKLMLKLDSTTARILIRRTYRLMFPRDKFGFSDKVDTLTGPDDIVYLIAYPVIKDEIRVFCSGDCANQQSVGGHW